MQDSTFWAREDVIYVNYVDTIIFNPGCDAGTVSTKDNVTARIGFHPTDFECTFTIDADESVHAGDILWQVERPSGVYQIIAEFTPPDVHGKHNQFTSTATGSEFKSRAVLYDVVSSGTNTYTAVFRLNEIKCEDEGNFRCLVGYTTSTGSYNQSSEVSLMVTGIAMNIQVALCSLSRCAKLCQTER